MAGNSLKLGRIFGIEVGLHWSWVFIFGFVTWAFATGIFDEFYPEWTTPQKWIGGALVSIVFFLSVLAHELSHAIVSNRAGLPVKSITLFIFGGVANLSKEPEHAGLEFRIAVVGPLTSLVLGGLFAALWAATYQVSEGFAGICANLAIINVSLALFNMLPGFPLDGGRVFRAIVWSRNKNRLRATRIASKVGEWIAYGIMALGIVYMFWLGPFSGLWLLFIGFFLRAMASASYQQLVVETTLTGVTVADIMQRNFTTVPPDLTVDALVNDYLLRGNARAFPVMAAGDFAGLITLTDVRRVPSERWRDTSVYRAMTPAGRLYTVSPTVDITHVMRAMAVHDVNQLPVVQGRELVGMLNRADVMRFIQLRQDLAGENGHAPGHPLDGAERREEVGAKHDR